MSIGKQSTLYNGLNGSYFSTNSDFDYLQNNTWLNKIANWTWSAVNTETFDDGSASDYYNGLSPKEIYLHEMNRSTKISSIGKWTNPQARVGLMYASDYALSLGNSALALTTGTLYNRYLLQTGWIHQNNNNGEFNTWEWILPRAGNCYDSNFFTACSVNSEGELYITDVDDDSLYSRPVFYLSSNVLLSSGDGSLNNPYIIEQ